VEHGLYGVGISKRLAIPTPLAEMLMSPVAALIIYNNKEKVF
jgi:hypothetical protein